MNIFMCIIFVKCPTIKKDNFQTRKLNFYSIGNIFVTGLNIRYEQNVQTQYHILNCIEMKWHKCQHNIKWMWPHIFMHKNMWKTFKFVKFNIWVPIETLGKTLDWIWINYINKINILELFHWMKLKLCFINSKCN